MSEDVDCLLEPLATPNLGVLDCLLRIGLGVLMIALAVDATIGPWGYSGFFGVATGATWVCPAYRWFGLSTARGDSGSSCRRATPVGG